MTITRLYSDDNGDSRFEVIEIPLDDAGDIGRLSKPHPATGIIFRENDADYNYDWHNAPQRQYIIMLDGAIEIETSRGEVRTFRAGDILLVEDTTGKGHKTKAMGGNPRRSIFITLDEQ
ncbi:MAG: hypothetical protein D6675_10910 [Gemmatimonadetes bacterium]|nr:MAG: hypothetical protein D6675_10910 [Gemmatimonadota bacterium]